MAYDEFTAKMVTKVSELEAELEEKDKIILDKTAELLTLVMKDSQKDREIARLGNMRDSLLGHLATCKSWKEDWQLEVREHSNTKSKYHDLMRQAVIFATVTISDTVAVGEVKRAQAFLASPEVQAFRDKEQQHDT